MADFFSIDVEQETGIDRDLGVLEVLLFYSSRMGR